MAKKGTDENPQTTRPDWMRRHIWQIQPVRDVLVILAVFGLFWLGYKLSIVTVPILLALALAYLFDPVIRWLTTKANFSRHAAVSSIIAAAVLVVAGPVTFGVVMGAEQAIDTARSIARNIENTEVVREIAQQIAVAEAETTKPFVEIPEDGMPITYPDDGRLVEFELSEVDGEPWQGRPLTTERWAGQPATANMLKDSYADSRWIFRLYQRNIIEGQILAAIERDQAARAEQKREEEERRQNPTPNPTIENRPPQQPDQAPQNPDLLNQDPASQPIGEGGPDLPAASQEAEDLDPPPVYQVRQRGLIDAVFDFVAGYVDANREALSARAIGTSVDAASMIIGSVASISIIAFMAFLTAFFFYFIASAYGPVVNFLRRLVPEKDKERYLDLADKMDGVISGFIRGRLIIAAIQAVFFSLAYWFVGVPFFLIIGCGVAILSIVPYLALIGIPISIVLMAVNAPEDGLRGAWWWILGAPTAVYFIGQALDDYVWTPKIQGQQTGMDTPSILFATIAGGALAGFYGVLLAIPVAACLKILIKEIFWPRFKAWSEGKERDFLPIGRS